MGSDPTVLCNTLDLLTRFKVFGMNHSQRFFTFANDK